MDASGPVRRDGAKTNTSASNVIKATTAELCARQSAQILAEIGGNAFCTTK